MNLRIYFHQYIPVNDKTWVFIFLDQIKALEDSKLLDHVEYVNIIVSGDSAEFDAVRRLTGLNNKIKFDFILKERVDERITLKQFWLDSKKEDFYALYMHNKGMTAHSKKYLMGEIEIFRNYFYWRKYIEWGCIERWRECIAALETNEAAGVNFNELPVKHYSGGFWWARSDYIRTLDDIEDSEWWRQNRMPYYEDRLIAEFWPLSKAKNIFNIHGPGEELCYPNQGLYSLPYRKINYET